MTDNPVTTSVHKDHHDPDGKPGKQEVVLSDEQGRMLIVHHHPEGGATLQYLAHAEIKSQYLSAEMYVALITAGFQRLKELDEWDEDQELVRQRQEQKTAYDAGFLALSEYDRLTAEQATREAADNGVNVLAEAEQEFAKAHAQAAPES